MKSFVDELPGQLKQDIIRISEENDGAFTVFQELYNYLTDTKRRKVPETPSTASSSGSSGPIAAGAGSGTVLVQLRDLSIASPVRKKLTLTLSVSSTTNKPALTLAKSADDAPELVIDDITPSNVTFATFLPVPEKKSQLYLVIFYRRGSNATNEPIVATLNVDAVCKQLEADGKLKPTDDLVQYLIRMSALAQMQVSNTFTPSFHVQAHRGTKEGYLYFLPQHILFGFKKPILLFHASEVESISYSSITRITFNVTLVLKSGDKLEFSMIDQQDFNQIDGYVKNKEVSDTSMSDEHKAKPTKKNQEHQGELDQAATQLMVQEPGEADSEEEDEDYVAGPGRDDTSDVSGEEGSDDSGDEYDEDNDEAMSEDDEGDMSGDREVEAAAQRQEDGEGEDDSEEEEDYDDEGGEGSSIEVGEDEEVDIDDE